MISPRLALALVWIFTDFVDRAYDSFIVPFLGLLVLPWTTLIYAWMWSIDSDGVHGWEWALVGAALLVDVVFWVAGRRSLRQ